MQEDPFGFTSQKNYYSYYSWKKGIVSYKLEGTDWVDQMELNTPTIKYWNIILSQEGIFYKRMKYNIIDIVS